MKLNKCKQGCQRARLLNVRNDKEVVILSSRARRVTIVPYYECSKCGEVQPGAMVRWEK